VCPPAGRLAWSWIPLVLRHLNHAARRLKRFHPAVERLRLIDGQRLVDGLDRIRSEHEPQQVEQVHAVVVDRAESRQGRIGPPVAGGYDPRTGRDVHAVDVADGPGGDEALELDERLLVSFRSVLQLIVVMLLWAACFPLITVGIGYAPHMTFAAMRASIAGTVLVFAAVVLRRPAPSSIRVWTILGLIGLGATTLGFLGMFHAAEFVSPGIATVIANTQPLLAAVPAQVFLGERLDRRGQAALVLGFVGVLLLTMPQMLGPGGGTYRIGLGYIVLAALGITMSNLLIKRLAGEIDSVMAMGLQMLIGSLPLWLTAVFLERGETTVWSLEFAVALLALSLVGTSLAYWLWCATLARVELNRANVFAFLVPMFGLAIGGLWFGERLETLQLLGIGLTIVGAGLVLRPKRLKARTPANTRKAAVERTKSQPKVEMIQVSTSSATTPTPSVSSTPQSTNASEMPAAM
jgi:drug/metabolite transporter (DMT)-like permease